MKNGKKVISLLLAFILVFALAACGKSDTTGSQNAAANSKDYVYAMEDLPIALEGADISDVLVSGDKIYAFGQHYDWGEDVPQPREEVLLLSSDTAVAVEEVVGEETEQTEETTDESETTDSENTDAAAEDVEEPVEDEMVEGTMDLIVGVFDMSGTLLNTFSKSYSSNTGSNGMTVDEEGNIYLLIDEYGKDISDPENPKDVFTLFSYDSQGNERWNVVLGAEAKPEDYYYVNQFAIDNKGNLVVLSSSGIEVYGPDAKKITDISIEGDEGASNLVMLKGETCALICYGEDSVYLKTVDMETKKLSEAQKFPFNSYSYSMFSGKNYDLFLTDSNGLYGFNLGDADVTKIMDYVDSDIVTENIFGIKPIDDTTFVGTYYDNETGVVECAKFTKVDPSTIKDKQILTLGCMYLDSDIRKQVVAFNKSNDEYRIKVMDYSSYNTDDDYTAGTTKLNTDIVAGNMPDIIMLSGDMPTKSYVSKGLFADMNPFFENDPELKKEDYLPNVMEALSEDGKMYQLAPAFYIFTVFGKTADVGSESGWTFEDLEKLMAQKGPDVQAFADITRQDFMNYSMWFCNEQYIDWQTGECRFNSEDFIKNLEFANQYPAEISYENYDESYWDSYQTAFREGRTLLMLTSLSTFSDYTMNEYGSFGEEVTPIGFPAPDKNGNAMNFNMNFAISAKSKNQDAAWNFIRYFLTDEYQDQLEYCLPVKISSLEASAVKAQSRPYYEDENGNKVEYDNSYYLNGEEVIIPPMTQEETDKVMNFIKSVNHVMDYNNSISGIITEESEAYFTGQKTAQEVADIIQSRVQIYVNENR